MDDLHAGRPGDVSADVTAGAGLGDPPWRGRRGVLHPPPALRHQSAGLRLCDVSLLQSPKGESESNEKCFPQ